MTSFEIAFPILVFALGVGGALWFRHSARQIDAARARRHPAE